MLLAATAVEAAVLAARPMSSVAEGAWSGADMSVGDYLELQQFVDPAVGGPDPGMESMGTTDCIIASECQQTEIYSWVLLARPIPAS